MGDLGMTYLPSFCLIFLIFPRYCYLSFTREMICSLSIFPSGLNIGWESRAQKEMFIRNGLYVPRNILPTRFQMCNDSIFITLPRYRCGVPFTLGKVSFKDYCKAEPLMYPFPNWLANKYDQDEAIHNAIDLVVDEKQVLWVLDIGVINTLDKPKFLDTPRVLGICLKTSQVTHIINLSPLVSEKSRFQYIQVEIVNGKTYMYISDAGTNSIVVWDTSRGNGYKVVLPPNVREGTPPCKDDVLYIVLLKGKCDRNILYLTYLYGKKMFHIETHNLRSGKATGSVEEDGSKPGRIVLLGSDQGIILFFRLRGKADIFMWNSTKDFHPENLILAQPIDSGRFPTHITAGYQRLIWTLESNFPDFMADRVNDMGPSAKIHPTLKFCDDEFIV